MFWIYIAMALLAGVILPVQAGANAQLRMRLGNAITVTFICLVLSLIFTSICIVIMRVSFPAWEVLRQIPWWYWCGGILGIIYLIVSTLLVKRLGAVILNSALIAGQILCSLTLDATGLMGYHIQPLTLPRSIGALLLITGVLLVGQEGEKHAPGVPQTRWLLLIPLLVGTLMPMQAGLNSHFASQAGHPLWGLGISLCGGLLICILIIVSARIPSPQRSMVRTTRWWHWTGGPVGVIYGLIIVIASVPLGATTFVGLVVTGQIVTSLLLDHLGWLGFQVRRITLWRLTGVSLLILGMGLIRFVP